MSEEKKFDEKEVKEKALEIFQSDFNYKKEFKKNKFIYQQLKNLTVEDLEILPAIHPIVSVLSYEVAIFWHGQRKDGTFYGDEIMEGKWEISSPNFCISEEGLDDISLKIIKNYSDYTYNDRMSNGLREFLCAHAISLYKRDNEVSLYNYPGKLRATISTFSPVSEIESAWGYNPIAAKIKNADGKELYFVINVYEDAVKKFASNPFSFLYLSNLIIFDNDKKTYKVKEGLFGYKLI